MQVIKSVNIENIFTRIITKHKIEILKYEEDDVYVITFRKYFNDETECSMTFSGSYIKFEDAQKQFDFYVNLAIN